MFKTTKPNEQRERQFHKFEWSLFAKECLLNIYALVIGSEAVLNPEINKEWNGNSAKMLLDKTLYQKASETIKRLFQNKRITSLDTRINKEYQRLKNCYKNFSEFAIDTSTTGVKELVLNATDQLIKDGINLNMINPQLLELLRTRCFRIVITTDISPLLELAMEDVWGKDGFDVVILEEAPATFNQVYEEFNVVRPTLCYAFGKVDSNTARFVLTENDAVEKYSRLFETKSHNGFLEYLLNYNILSIGPKYDDWLFRFFWFLIRGVIHSNLGVKEQSTDGLQIAVEVGKNSRLRKGESDNLIDYLKQEKVEVFNGNEAGNKFMKKAVEQIIKANMLLRLPRIDNGVFISYSHNDRYIALPLFEKLRSEGIPVWIDDEELDHGDDFKSRIADAINGCKFFMPILSTTTKEHISSKKMKNQWYYQNEWTLIQERYEKEEEQLKEVRKIDPNNHPKHSFKVLPFIVGDYHYNTPYHQSTPDCFREASISDAFRLTTDAVENLISSIKQR